MNEFYAFSWVTHISITFILGINLILQCLALMLNLYRSSLTLNTPKIFENLFEVSILCGILVFAFLHGQMINGFKNGFLVPIGYENIRILVFIVILLLSVIVCIIIRSIWPISVMLGTLILLPIVEKLFGYVYPWLFIAALIFFLCRSIYICVSSIIAIKTNISTLSVINAVDRLHTGVLFSENDGHILISNHQMQNLMISMTGKIFRNSIDFYDSLVLSKNESRYKKAELEGQMVYILNKGSAWMLTRTDIFFKGKKYFHISLTDVSELWELTITLKSKNEKLMKKSDELKKTISNLHILSRNRQIEDAKMRAHDILGQRLTVLLRTIQNEHELNYDLLISLSKGLLAELKAEQNEIQPYDEIKDIQHIFAAIGVDIEFEGQLPDNEQQASLFVDIIREGSTNAVRHGFATQINVKTESIGNTSNLTIKNNGHTSNSPIIPGSGLGLMRRKVDAQGGNLDISYYPMFTLSVVLPGGDQY